MTYLVTDNCVKCKHTDCVAVCPVDCFYEGEDTLVINPDECIDCGVCVPECPVGAIVADVDLPEDSLIIWMERNTRCRNMGWCSRKMGSFCRGINNVTISTNYIMKR